MLGTDGFGRSDYRRKLRDFFEVDRRWVALAALESLAAEGTVPRSRVAEAIKNTGSTRRSRARGRCEARLRLTTTRRPDRRVTGRGRVAATNEIQVPDIGDFKDVPIIEIHVNPGDAVKTDDPLITLESDKATMDVPAPRDGTVDQLLVKVGDKVSEGTAILRLKGDGGGRGGAGGPAALGHRPAGARAAAAPAAGPPPAFSPPAAGGGRGRGRQLRRRPREPVGPPAGARARHRPHQAQGHGREGPRHPGGRAELPKGPAAPAAAAAAPSGGMGIPEIPAVDFSKFGPVETRPLARIKRISGPFLHRAWLNVPHVTHGDEADITEIEEYRKQLDSDAKADKKKPYRVSLLPFLMKASVSALKMFPSSTAR